MLRIWRVVTYLGAYVKCYVICSDHSTIFFNSHDISSGDSSRSKLTTVWRIRWDKIYYSPQSYGSAVSLQPAHDDVAIALPLNLSAVDSLTEELHNKLKMTMYGVDIIASTETGKQYVIDVNVFPGKHT